MSTPTSDSAPFTPSELVVLFGDRFAPEAGMLASKEEVLTSGVKVNAQRLMEEALSAALLAVHASGAARLEERTGTTLFGLMKKHTLHLVRGTGASLFPAGSVEAALVAAASGREAWEALTGWIGHESTDPSVRILSLIKEGLAARGLLEVRERKALKLFTVSTFVLPDAARHAASAEPLEPVQELLRQGRQREPGLWKAVQKAIDTARAQMTERSDD
jgi:hypothetical protein